VAQAKQRLRDALTIGRDRQLRDHGVQRFLRRMHRTVVRPIGRTSIADVIDTGKDLVDRLQHMRGLSPELAARRLREVVDPVIEVCDAEAKCSVSGLALGDIWRYFRHTWSLEYRSIPGRQMALLVRNAAHPKRPVMGIAMLASPVVQLRVRDDWIGWTAVAYTHRIRSGQLDPELATRALVNQVDKAIAEIRADDLVAPDELVYPTENTVLRLEQKSHGAAHRRRRELQQRYEDAVANQEEVRSERDLPKRAAEATDWLKKSEDNLFVKKRAEVLARLLFAKRMFQQLDWGGPSAAFAKRLLGDPCSIRAIDIALGELRKNGLASQVADVSVCGAVPPYGPLVVGKLVALLMTSQEVRDAYRSRYSDHVSYISSQMAGRPIFRPAELKLLTTTSLYGRGSSQYSRLKLRMHDYAALAHDVMWEEVATTAGYGTVHLSPLAVELLRNYSQKVHQYRIVNHRFGEGASPRMRQIRQALDDLGIESCAILNHASPRIFYGCQLQPQSFDELLGLRPPSESTGPSLATIADVWRLRWLSGRINSDDVLTSVSALGPTSLRAYFDASGSCATSEHSANRTGTHHQMAFEF
jgi:hypothetical protein